MICKECGCEKPKGYNRNPTTGRPSKDFWCDDCFELGMMTAQRDYAYREHLNDKTKGKAKT
jgi:hypothetical protein